MVDTLDSGSSTLKKCGGSNPLSRTKRDSSDLEESFFMLAKV